MDQTMYAWVVCVTQLWAIIRIRSLCNCPKRRKLIGNID